MQNLSRKTAIVNVKLIIYIRHPARKLNCGYDDGAPVFGYSIGINRSDGIASDDDTLVREGEIRKEVSVVFRPMPDLQELRTIRRAPGHC